MDAGFYSADYLRAWIRHAQLRAHLIAEVGEDWWRRRETGESCAELFARGRGRRARRSPRGSASTRSTPQPLVGRAFGVESADARSRTTTSTGTTS